MRPQDHAAVLAQTRELLDAQLPEILPLVSAIARAAHGVRENWSG